MKDTIDRKELELLIEKLESYYNTAWGMCDYYKELGSEWKIHEERNLGEATAYDIAIIMLKKIVRGDVL